MATGIESAQVDIEIMAKETGISEDQIRNVLDPLDPKILQAIEMATTVEAIKEVYFEAPWDSEAQREALAKWIEMATTIKEIIEVYSEAPENSEAERAAIRKLATFFLKAT